MSMNFAMLIVGGLVVVFLVTLVFVAVLRSRKIGDVPPYEQPGGGAGSMYVIGDSTGAGIGASRSEDSVMGRLGNDYTWYRIQNESLRGRDILGAQGVALRLEGNYDVIVLQIGANDIMAGRPVAAIVTDMQRLIETVRKHAGEVVVLTAGNIGAIPRYNGDVAEHYENISRQYDAAMRDVANQWQDVHFVSLFDEPEQDPMVADPKRYIAKDGLHPTSDGYALWYEKARPYFEQILESK